MEPPARAYGAALAAAAALFCALCGRRLQHVQPGSIRCSAAATNADDRPARSRRRPAPSRSTELPPDGDLAYARAAAAEVLSRGDKGASQPWENPPTGARGTVTPIATAYTQDGQTCRDFLASYVSGHVAGLAAGRSLQARTRATGKCARSSPGSAPKLLAASPHEGALHPAAGTPH